MATAYVLYVIVVLVINEAASETGLVCISDLCSVSTSRDSAPAFYVNANWSTTVQFGSYEVCRVRLNGPVGASSAVVQLWNWQDEACRMGMRISVVERQSETYKLVYDKNSVRECEGGATDSKSEAAAAAGKEEWQVKLNSSKNEEWSLELEIAVAALTSWSKQAEGSKFGFDLAVTFEKNVDVTGRQESNDCVSCGNIRNGSATAVGGVDEAESASDSAAGSCIDVTLVCDGFVNCLRTAMDEMQCDEDERSETRSVKSNGLDILKYGESEQHGNRDSVGSVSKQSDAKRRGVWIGNRQRLTRMEMKQIVKQVESSTKWWRNVSSVAQQQTDRDAERYRVNAKCSFDRTSSSVSEASEGGVSRRKRDVSTTSSPLSWLAWHETWTNWYSNWENWLAWNRWMTWKVISQSNWNDWNNWYYSSNWSWDSQNTSTTSTAEVQSSSWWIIFVCIMVSVVSSIIVPFVICCCQAHIQQKRRKRQLAELHDKIYFISNSFQSAESANNVDSHNSAVNIGFQHDVSTAAAVQQNTMDGRNNVTLVYLPPFQQALQLPPSADNASNQPPPFEQATNSVAVKPPIECSTRL